MEEREVLSFLISFFVMIFVCFQWSKIKSLPFAGLLFACFAALFASWTFSVVEDIFWKDRLNFLQHLSSGVSGLLQAVWLGLVYRLKKKPGA